MIFQIGFYIRAELTSHFLPEGTLVLVPEKLAGMPKAVIAL